MNTGSVVLLGFWTAVAEHLWQSTLVLLALAVLALALRRAPGRIQHRLWTLGLIQLAVPMGLLGRPGIELPANSITVTVASGILNPPALDGLRAASPGPKVSVLLLLLTVTWATCTLFLLARWMIEAFRNRPGNGLPAAADPEARARFKEVVRKIGVRPEHVEVTGDRRIPGVSGILFPKIRISADLLDAMEPDALQAILLHEEAHRRRREPLRYAVQRLVFCLFFFFPPLWIVLRQLHDSAELACDETALDRGAMPETYLAALHRVVKLDLAPAASVAGMAGARPSSFARRLLRIQHYERRIPMIRHRIALAAGIAALSVGFFTAGAPEKSQPQLPGKDGIENPVRLAEHFVQPVYPEAARKDKVTASVILQVVVREDGTVADLTVLKQAARGEDDQEIDAGKYGFGEAAMEAVRQWRYEPAEKDGEPVAVYLTVHIKFALDNDKPGKAEPVT